MWCWCFFCLLMVCFCGSFREDIIFRQVAWPTCRLFLPLLRFCTFFWFLLFVCAYLQKKGVPVRGVTAYPPANYLADCRSKISGRISVGALFDITYPRLSGQFMVLCPAGRTYRCGRNYRFVYRVDFLIRHICGAGVWASALTENQIIAFLYTLVVAFLLYTGLDFIAGIPLFEDYQTSIQFWGIHFHYEPMSRGVIAFSDVVYFVSFVFLFLWATVRRFHGIRLGGGYVIIAFVVLNLACTRVYLRADITDDKRYTLSESTCSLLRGIDRGVSVDIFWVENYLPVCKNCNS